jgi:hypothetical protein
MRMGNPSEEDLVGLISDEVALTKEGWGPTSDLMSAYNRFNCDFYVNPELERAWSDVYSWFESLEGTRTLSSDPLITEVLRTGTKEDRAAYLRGAIGRLRRCA